MMHRDGDRRARREDERGDDRGSFGRGDERLGSGWNERSLHRAREFGRERFQGGRDDGGAYAQGDCGQHGSYGGGHGQDGFGQRAAFGPAGRGQGGFSHQPPYGMPSEKGFSGGQQHEGRYEPSGQGGQGSYGSTEHRFAGGTRSVPQQHQVGQFGQTDSWHNSNPGYARHSQDAMDGTTSYGGGPCSGPVGGPTNRTDESYGRMGWREHPLQGRGSVIDPEYSQWRDQQLRALDEDYYNWRQERFRKFSEEFSRWRSSRKHRGESNGSEDGGFRSTGSTAAGTRDESGTSGSKTKTE